jgi:hypothetical protein
LNELEGIPFFLLASDSDLIRSQQTTIPRYSYEEKEEKELT